MLPVKKRERWRDHPYSEAETYGAAGDDPLQNLRWMDGASYSIISLQTLKKYAIKYKFLVCTTVHTVSSVEYN